MKEGMFAQVCRFSSSQKRFLISQIIASTYNNIITGVLMTGLLLYIGVKPSRVGVFLSIPLLANVLQIFVGKFWEKFNNEKNAINRIVFISRLCILSIIFIPIMFGKESGEQRSLGVVLTGIILFFAYIFASSSGIRLNYWMVNCIEPATQGTFFAFRDRIMVIGTTAIGFLASYLIDWLTEIEMEFVGFATAFFIAAVLSLFDYEVVKKITYYEVKKKKANLQFEQYFNILKNDRKFRYFIIYMFFMNLALNLANPYYNVYMLDYLGLPFTKVMMLTTLQVCVQILASSFWGRIANCTSWRVILNWAIAALGTQFFIWPLVTKNTIGLIYLIFITSGLIATGLVTGQFMAPYEFIRIKHSMLYLSLCTSISACGGFAGSMLGSKIISSLNEFTIQFGNMSFGSMQINMIISGAMLWGTVLYARIFLRKYSNE